MDAMRGPDGIRLFFKKKAIYIDVIEFYETYSEK